jgi:hypothetical protein
LKEKGFVKIRVIVVSKALRTIQAEQFAGKTKDLFKSFFVFSGLYYSNGEGIEYPQYFVVRIPGKGEDFIEGHELMVERGELLGNYWGLGGE